MSPWSVLSLHLLLATASPEEIAPAPTTTFQPTTRLALTVAAPLVALRAPLARALVDAGFTVAGPAAGAAGHQVTLEAADGGVVIAVRGAVSTAGVVPPGPPALVELEVAQRVAALVLASAPAPHAGDVGVTVAMQPAGNDDGDGVVDDVIGALLDGGVAIAPAGAAPALCVEVVGDDVEVGLAPGPDRPCATVERVARADFHPEGLVARLRTPAPAPPTPTTRSAPTTTTTATTATTPWRFGVAGGALVREGGVDPLLWSSVAHRVARVGAVDVDVVGAVAGSGSAAGLVVVEPLVAGGVEATTTLAGLRVGLGLLGGVQTHGYGFESELGITGDGVLLVPATVVIPLGETLGLQLGAGAGASTRARTHTVDGLEVWRRGNVFMSVFAGLSFSLPGSGAADENRGVLARGGG